MSGGLAAARVGFERARYIAPPVARFTLTEGFVFTPDSVVVETASSKPAKGKKATKAAKIAKAKAAKKAEIEKSPLVTLCERMLTKFVFPSLEKSTTVDEYNAFWHENWNEYLDIIVALRAFAAIEGTSAAGAGNLEGEARTIAKDIGKFAGVDAVKEFDFSLMTYLRAMRIVGRFEDVAQEKEPEDQKIGQAYVRWSNLWFLMFVSLRVASMKAVAPKPPVLEFIWEQFRESALTCYSLARSGYDLRHPETAEDKQQPLFKERAEFDDEDRLLAKADYLSPDFD